MSKSKVKVNSTFLKTPQKTEKHISQDLEKKSIVPLLISILLILLVSAAVAGGYFSGFFNVKTFKYVTANVTSQSEIDRIMQDETKGKLILSVNPGTIEKLLLDKIKVLSFARVTKGLPSTLVVEVKERTKAAVFRTLENIVLVSQDGVVIQELDESQITNNMYQDIQVIKLIDEPKRSVGYTFDSVFVSDATTVLSSWSSEKAPKFSDIIIDKDKNVKIALENSGLVVLSISAPNIDIKAMIADMTSVYNRLSQSKKIKSLDMRFDKIAVTYF